jgi:predicted Zn-ribbon and HTH transcriptional regulator
LETAKGLRYYRPKAVLADEIRLIARMVKEHRLGLVIIDSASKSCGGSIDLEETNAFFMALDRLTSLGAATLTIAHETKAQNNEFAYGSVQFFNAPRKVWNIRAEKEEEESKVKAVLIHKKANDAALHAPIPVSMWFGRKPTGEDFVDIRRGSLDGSESGLNLTTRILMLLSKQPEGLSAKDIADELGEMNLKQVKVLLNYLKNKGKILNDKLEGKWGVKRFNQDPPVKQPVKCQLNEGLGLKNYEDLAF